MKNWLVIANASRTRVLEEGDKPGRFVDVADLVLVASSPFLGLLRAHLGEPTRKAIARTIDADDTALPDRELAQRLAQPQADA
jgi:hypothetical protein